MIRWLLLCLLCVGSHSAQAQVRAQIRVMAAASLTPVLTELSKTWQRQGHAAPQLVFAASSTLAKQIQNGAPAQVFISADQGWMDAVATRQTPQGSRILARNALVLVAPINRPFAVNMQRGFDLASAFQGKLCTGESQVPLGKYAAQALQFFGWDGALAGRIVGTDDARTALAFVERGECGAGVIYATDAYLSPKVRIVGTFPEASHAPIVYPAALIAPVQPEAQAFLAFLFSPSAQAVFKRYGFL